jgi:hypothetical protein
MRNLICFTVPNFTSRVLWTFDEPLSSRTRSSNTWTCNENQFSLIRTDGYSKEFYRLDICWVVTSLNWLTHKNSLKIQWATCLVMKLLCWSNLASKSWTHQWCLLLQVDCENSQIMRIFLKTWLYSKIYVDHTMKILIFRSETISQHIFVNVRLGVSCFSHRIFSEHTKTKVFTIKVDSTEKVVSVF